ncbi:hypothetical protein M419DRAFT_4544 [Trichoderma reesei RUT C-30]|uniref:F-box domain-containing protein n=1 Tax=Hypocrea jecorina (strain ATCC 56765 / BCRC 32924 / NRRL 11460 / Rut C-30) TaxID=1344414 RepID=A0A024SJN4_HYPJR|nr:hypothetical protein M419DRAFT_4544 [Trichoderma reesei RUT C-30]
MPHLLSLPVEVILHICRQLRHPRTLSCFCRTSKAFHSIATPILYACFDNGGLDGSPVERGLEQSIKFLTAISLRPELGEFVRELRIEGSCSKVFDQSQDDMFRKAAARLGMDIPCPSQQGFEAMACLLITQTPNLTTLDVYIANNGHDRDDSSPFGILENASPPVPLRIALPHLRQLHLGQSSEEVSLRYFGGILQFAAGLTDLTLRTSFKPPPASVLCDDLMHFRNVTHLDVKGLNWTQRGLDFVVSRCHALVKFRYQSLEVAHGIASPTVTARELIEMLRQHGHNKTLRSLNVDMKYLYPPFICPDGEQVPSLKDFSRLETFCVDGTSIQFPAPGSPDYRTDILTNMLPSCVRHFDLTYAPNESVTNLFWHYVVVRGATIPFRKAYE